MTRASDKRLDCAYAEAPFKHLLRFASFSWHGQRQGWVVRFYAYISFFNVFHN